MPDASDMRGPFDVYDFFGYLASGIVVIAGMEVTLGFPLVLGRDLKAVDYAVLVLATYVAGQIVATPAKALLEDVIVFKILGPPSVNLLREKRPRVRSIIFPGFYKPLPKEHRSRVRDKARAEGVSTTGEDLFYHVRFSKPILKDPLLQARLNTALNKYGFARNLAFTSLLFGAAVLIKARIHPDPCLVKYGEVGCVVGILLFYRYLKFFRQYSSALFYTYAVE
jgi:hypothetical protein